MKTNNGPPTFDFQLYALRRLMQGSVESPKAPLGNNARPLQQLHHRTVRTNIDFQNGKVVQTSFFFPSLSLFNLFITDGHLGYFFPFLVLRNISTKQNQKCPSMHKEMYYKGRTKKCPEPYWFDINLERFFNLYV